jgi:hypothetical protein
LPESSSFSSWAPRSVVCASGSAWAGTDWVVHLATGSKGEAHAQALPAAPAGPAASCNAPVTSKTIKVTWSAVTHATTYSVYDSTTSATGTYSLLASGVATTSWTSGTLGGGTRYWFEVVANVGSNWSSVKSAATGSSLINALTQLCIQP